MAEVTITRHGSDRVGEYHAHLPGETEIGRLTWVMHGTVRAAEHTLVPREIGGQGVAGKLVEALIADAREQGVKAADPLDSVKNWGNQVVGIQATTTGFHYRVIFSGLRGTERLQWCCSNEKRLPVGSLFVL